MPRSMHVVRGLTSLNTRKPKIKLTKKKNIRTQRRAQIT